MSEPYIGEIIAVGFYFDSSGFGNGMWQPCDGRLVPIARNTALFSLIGTYYGGDGKVTFALPDLNSRVAISQGQGPGLTLRDLGEQIGEDQVSLSPPQLPAHVHPMQLGKSGAANATPGPGAAGSTAAINPTFNGFVPAPADTKFAATAIGPYGGVQSHANDQPTTSLWYLIAMSGIYPSFG